MSQSNTAAVQAIYQAFGEGRVPDILAALADNLTFVQPGGADIPWSGTYSTPAEVGGFFAKLGAAVEVTRFEPRRFIEAGDTVVALGAWAGKGRASGKPFACEWAMSWTFKDGKVVDYASYIDTAAMARAL